MQRDAAIGGHAPPADAITHTPFIRVTHWINAVAMVLMILSGWRIYDASPEFPFTIPRAITIGGWLGGALQWHFAAMWLLVLNWLAYIVYGFWSGHFRATFLPITPAGVLSDLRLALSGRLAHVGSEYNQVQRLAYVGVLAAILVTILSGLAIWKPTQLQVLGSLFGGYHGARIVHFLGMAAIVLFLVVHLALVVIVPRTLLAMLTGSAAANHADH